MSLGRRLAALSQRLRRFEPTSVRPVDIMVWDAVGSEWIQHCLQGQTVRLFYVRGEQYNVHPRTLWLTMRYRSKVAKFGQAYARAVIHQARPKVIATFMDNSNFHLYAEHFPGTRFIAIQNGWRFPDVPGIEPPLARDTHYDSELYCFGQIDVDGYAALGITFKSVTVVGSLKNAIYAESDQASANPALVSAGAPFDICLVSQFRNTLPDSSLMKADFDTCTKLMRDYLASHPDVRVAVAMASRAIGQQEEHDAESAYFAEVFGDRVTLFSRDAIEFGAYVLADASNLVISSNSTAVVEALARRRKTLITGSLLRSIVSNDSRPIFVLEQDTSMAFDQVVERLLQLPASDFWDEEAVRHADYLMPALSECSAVEVLRKQLG